MIETQPRTFRRAHEAFLLAVILFSYAFFQHPVLFDNALTRLDLTYAVVFHGTVRIDDYHTNTVDKAFRNGHFYCDKAPGLSLAAVSVLAGMRTMFRTLDFKPDNALIAAMLTLLIVSIPSALAFLLLFRIFEQMGVKRPAAMTVTFFTALGTLCFTYSTQFYGHQFAAAFLIAALYLIVTPVAEGNRPSNKSLFVAGLLLGGAVMSDYPAAVPAAAVAAFALYAAGPRAAFVWLPLGAALPLAALAGYNHLSFGNAFSIGYFHEMDPTFNKGMGRGLGGVTVPRPLVMLKLLFTPQRGLLWSSPFLLFAAPGAIAFLKIKDWRRALGITALAAFLGAWLVNAAYYEPYGGFAPGPRFLVMGIPFLAILVAAAWQNAKPGIRCVIAAAGILSMSQHYFLNAIEPHVPMDFASPVFQYSLPLMRQDYFASSLGLLFGLNGWIAWIPLAMFLCFSCFVFINKYVESSSRKLLLAVLLFSIIFSAGFYGIGENVRKPSHEASAMQFSNTWLRRGLAELRTGQYSLAESHLKKSLSSDPANLQASITLAAFYVTVLQEPETARPILERALSIGAKKHDPRVRYVLQLLRILPRENKQQNMRK